MFHYPKDLVLIRGGSMLRRAAEFAVLLLFVSSLAPVYLPAQDAPGRTAVLQAVGMHTRVSRFGQVPAYSPDGSRLGMYWPESNEGKASYIQKGLVYSGTPLLSGYVRGELRVSGNVIHDNYFPGPIGPGMKIGTPDNPLYRVYTIRAGQAAEDDYLDWPAQLGAPVDTSGAPLFYGSPQMFWVMNDLDTTSMQAELFSDPMGVEVQCVLHPHFSQGNLTSDALILRLTYINKSSDTIREAYIGYRADPDIRDAQNDAAGSDSARALAYVYDQYRYQHLPDEDAASAAFGVCMLQTPVTPAEEEDRARWKDGWRAGYRNVSLSAAVAPVKSAGPQQDPVGDPNRSEVPERYHALMQGRGLNAVVRNPLTGEPSRFWFNGDPVSGEGWLVDDGWLINDEIVSDKAGDKRILISAGPFDFAPGDTQQVVIALIAARGASRGAAVHLLRDRAEYLRQRHLLNPHIAGFSSAGLRTEALLGAGTEFRFTARTSGAPVTMEGEITDAEGGLIGRVPLKEIVVGNERVYSGSRILPISENGVNASFLAREGTMTWRLPASVSIPLAGDIAARGAYVLQEGDDNNRIAPDEQARWVPRLENITLYDLNVHIQHDGLHPDEWMYFPLLPAGREVPSEDTPWLPEFGSRTLPQEYTGWGTEADSTSFLYDVIDITRNSWWRLRNWIKTDSTAGEWYDVLMTQVRGSSEQRPGVRILDVSALQDRWYVAEIHEEYPGAPRTVTFRDSLTGFPYFSFYGLDTFTGMAPTTEGFRVVRGTIGSAAPAYDVEDTLGIDPAAFDMRAFVVGQNMFGVNDRADFRIVGDLSGTMVWNFADGGYEGLTRMPLHFFMRKNGGTWTRVHAAINEINPDIPDGQPDPDGGDYLLLYDIPYVADTAPGKKVLPDIDADLPAQLKLDLNAVPQSGSFNLLFYQPVTTEDLFVFNPRHVLLASSNKKPVGATMHPAAPMPFSDWTSVLLELQQDGSLRAEVYDMLGRRVKVLRDEFLAAGKHVLIWDGYWEDGRPAESGSYLLRAVASGEEITRRLMIVR